jgi:hypothetical protein
MSVIHKVTGALTVLTLSGVAHAGEFQFHPSITVSEEYTDNVFLTKEGRESDFITRGMPGVALAYNAPALTADVNYHYDYRYYAKRSPSTDQTHDLNANGKLTAVENLLFLELNDRYARVSLNVSKDVTHESLFVDQTDQNVATVSPYITLQPWKQTKVKTGYRFIDYRYFDSSGVDKTKHIGFLEAAYELTSKWSITCGYSYTREESAVSDYDQHQPYAGFRYEYSDKSFLFGQAGYTWIKYSDGHHLNNIYWNVGFSHAFDTLTATFSTGVRYDEDPLLTVTQETFVTGGLEKSLKRGTIGLTLYYSEFDLAETNTLQTRKYGGTLKGGYEFTSRFTGSLGFTAEKYEEQIPKTYTRRFVVEPGLNYLLAEKLTVSLNHVFVDSYSPVIATDNYQVNRIILGVSKVF